MSAVSQEQPIRVNNARRTANIRAIREREAHRARYTELSFLIRKSKFRISELSQEAQSIESSSEAKAEALAKLRSEQINQEALRLLVKAMMKKSEEIKRRLRNTAYKYVDA